MKAREVLIELQNFRYWVEDVKTETCFGDISGLEFNNKKKSEQIDTALLALKEMVLSKKKTECNCEYMAGETCSNCKDNQAIDSVAGLFEEGVV